MTTTATPDFEFFQGTTSESRTLPRITIRKGGLLVLTQAAAKMLGDEVTHIQLAYDSKNHAVGIRASAEDASGCYRLRTQPKSPGRLVGGKRFFQHHGLTIDKARTFDAVDFGNGIVGFTLPEDMAESEPVGGTARSESTPTGKRPATPRKAKAA